MSKYAKAKKALKELSSGSLYAIEPRELVLGLKAESDRAYVVMAVSQLDNALGEFIKQRANEIDRHLSDRLFEASGIAQTFSARIDICYLLGLFDREEWRRAHHLREMRNSCAHSHSPVTLQTPALRDAARLLSPISGDVHLPSKTVAHLRDLVVFNCLYLISKARGNADAMLQNLRSLDVRNG